MKLHVCLPDEFAHFAEGRKLYCYGAGRYIREFFEYYGEYGFEKCITAVADGDRRLDGTHITLNGQAIPVISKESLLETISQDDVILITVGIHLSAQVYNELDRILSLQYCTCYIAFLQQCYEYDYGTLPYYPELEGWRKNNTQKIPKSIHYCWFGEGNMSALHHRCIDSWKKFCPDYEITLWNEHNYDLANTPPWVQGAYENKCFSFVSDYVRLDLIYQHGGIYFDTDVEIIKPIDELRYNDAFIASDRTEVCTGSGFGASKGFPVVRTFIYSYEEKKGFDVEEDNMSMRWQAFDLRQKGLKLNNCFSIVENMTIYPRQLFPTKNLLSGIVRPTSQTFAIHHATATWHSETRQKNYDSLTKLYTRAVQTRKERALL